MTCRLSSLGALALVASLTGCPWKRDPGPAPLAEAEGPVRVVEVQDDGPMARLQVAVRAGSAHDPFSEEGLAWLVAQGIAQGGTIQLSPAEFDAALAAAGAHLDVTVSTEKVVFEVLAPAAHATRAADLLADAVVSPRFDVETLARLRTTALDELAAHARGVGEPLGLSVLDLWLFQGHPYGHLPQGRTGSVPAITDLAVRRFYDDRYVRPAVVAGVAGDPISRPAAGLLAARLESLPPRLYKDVTPRPRPEVEGRSVLLASSPAPQVAWFAGTPTALGPEHPDWPAACLALAALVARDPALIRGTDLGVEPALQHTWRVVGPATAPETATAALDALLVGLESFALHGLGSAELDRVRRDVIQHQGAWAARPAVALSLGLDAALMGRPTDGPSFATALGALDLAAVNAVIARHFHPENLRIVALGPDPDGLKRALTEENATSVVQQDEASAGSPPATPKPRAAEIHIVALEELVR